MRQKAYIVTSAASRRDYLLAGGLGRINHSPGLQIKKLVPVRVCANTSVCCAAKGRVDRMRIYRLYREKTFEPADKAT